MKRISLGLLAFALSMGLFCGCSYGKEEPDSGKVERDAADSVEGLRKTGRAFTSIARKVTPAVVFIQVEKNVEAPHGYHYNDPYGFFGDEFLERFFGGRSRGTPPRQRRQQGQGTGFIVTKDGYILTNNHVVGDADKILVKLHDGREVEAKRIGSDPKSEVAVIKIDAKDLPFVSLGSSQKLEIGEWVIAIGNPFGLSETLTVGVVSAKGRSGFGIAEYEDFIQTDAAINPGNSGGPLLNIDGEVVGINTAIYSQSGGSMGIGFAIPIDMGRAIMDQLIKTGKVSRGQIGIMIADVDEDMAEQLGLSEASGILINQVMEGSAGEKAGLRHGDVVVELNGKPVESTARFRNTIASQPPGTKFKLKVVRDGKDRTFTVVTGDSEAAAGAGVENEKLFEILGLSLENLTEDLAARLGVEPDEGVLVAQVDRDGQAAESGIQPGTLITNVGRRAISSVKEFVEAVEATQRKGRILVRIRTERYYAYVTLRVE